MNKTLIKLGIVAAIALGSFFYGKSLAPVKVNTVEVVKENRDIEIHKEEVVRPDGTKITTTNTKDKSKIDSSKKVEVNKPNWKVSALVGLNQDKKTIYGASVDRRILGNVFVGVWGNTDKTGGLSIGMEF